MPHGKNKQLVIRANFVPDSFNEENRTVEVVFATDTPVLRYSWRQEELYWEVLDMSGANLSLAGRGLPVLDNHSSWGSVTTNTLGRAENIRKENGVYVATVRFSKRDDVKPFVDDVKDGIISDVSFGYSVDSLERMEKKETDLYRTCYVRKWTPKEISFVNIPADPKAGVRSEDGKGDFDLLADLEEKEEKERSEKEKANSNKSIMKREQIIAMLAKRGITVEDTMTDDALTAELERALNLPEETPEDVRNTAINAERKRASDITLAVRNAKLKPEFGTALVEKGVTIDEARAAIIEELGKNDPLEGQRNIDTSVGPDGPSTLRRQSLEAGLIMRSAPELLTGDKKIFDDETMRAANNNRYMRLLDVAIDSLVRSGVNVQGVDPMEIVGRAFTSSSSDFGVILEGVNRRILLANYQAEPDVWRNFATIGSVSDFREHKRLRMGTFSDLEEVKENGEYKTKKITDADYEKVSIGTKGNLINVTRVMIINDDLNAFTRLASMLGRAAARTLENDFFKFLLSNPVLVDGVALFHASHGNIATAAAPTVDVISKMRQKMAKQQDKDKNDFLNIRPSVMLSPLSLYDTFNVLNSAQYEPTENIFQKPNTVRGMFKNVIDSPRLSDEKAYYMFADPNIEPVFEMSFLNGVQTPTMESQQGFSVDGTQWKIRHDFGIDVVGYRGVVKNAGA